MSRILLLATDHKQSVMAEQAGDKPNSMTYCAYGQPSAPQPRATRLAFNGALRERPIGWYFLGNGYRIYNPVLRCFHSPDSWSPFDLGGFNAYAYCAGDPVNFSDPTGHMQRRRRPSPPLATPPTIASAIGQRNRQPAARVSNDYSRDPLSTPRPPAESSEPTHVLITRAPRMRLPDPPGRPTEREQGTMPFLDWVRTHHSEPSTGAATLTVSSRKPRFASPPPSASSTPPSLPPRTGRGGASQSTSARPLPALPTPNADAPAANTLAKTQEDIRRENP